MPIYTGCFISICHFVITYISVTVGDMKTKLFWLKTNVLKFTQQKFECKNQRNKRFIKLFKNVQYASSCLNGTHRNGILFFAKLEQAYQDRWLSRPQLSESLGHLLTLEEEECRPSLLHSPREKSRMELGLEI